MSTLLARPRAALHAAMLCLLVCTATHAAITTSGDVTPDPNTTTSDDELYVGNTADGTMRIDGGSDVATEDSYVGYAAGASGAVTVDGLGSTWYYRYDLTVGRDGEGVLDISNGGHVTGGYSGGIGQGIGATGEVTVDGAGSSWSVSSDLSVGVAGTAALTIADGGQVTAFQAFVARQVNSSGTISIEGPGSTLTLNTASEVYVGYGGSGRLDITAGGQLKGGGGTLGRDAGSSGTATVSGTGSAWSTGGSIDVGEHGDGRFEITDGGQVESRYGYVGVYTGSTGTVIVDGSGSVWDIESGLGVGGEGGATLSVTAGGRISSGSGRVASNAGYTGSVTVDGADSAWDLGDSLSVGNSGAGMLNISHGGHVSSSSGYVGSIFSGRGNVISPVGSTGTVNVDGAGSTWTNRDYLHVGSAGTATLNITGGGLVEVAGYTQVGHHGGQGSIHFGEGTLTTGSLLASPSQLAGTGVVHTHGLVMDIDLVFDQSHGSQRPIVFDEQPDQHVTIDLDVDGTARLGAGYAGHGSLTVADGVTVTSSSGYLGYRTGSTGAATVDGAGSTWNNGGMFIGYDGVGTLDVTRGGQVNSGQTYLGRGPGSTGALTVDGAGSSWTNDGYLFVGYGGTGTLDVTGGGQVSSYYGYVGRELVGTGTVTVDGAGSRWINDALTVGSYGSAALNITGGGQVSSNGGAIVGWHSGSTGSITVDGAGSALIINNFLFVGMSGASTLNIVGGGQVELGGDLILGRRETESLVPGNGTINLVDGTLTMHGGAVSKDTGDATLNFTGGRLEGAGTIDLGAPLVQHGGTLAPGNSAGTTTINGGYTLDGGAIEIEINGLGTAGTDWDLVQVNGAVDLVGGNGLLNGTLDVILGYAPSPGDEYLVLENDDVDPIVGAFATWTTARSAFDGQLYQFAVDYTAGDGNDIALTSQGVVGLVGDYNGDGVVDAADYTVWRDAVGQAVAPYFGADGNGDGLVDDADCAVWKARYGTTAAGEAALAAVPEPAGLALLLLGTLVASVARQRSR